MNVELDDLGLDGLDFDDDFMSFDGNEDSNPEDRNPLNSLKTAAMDSLSDVDTYAQSARVIAKNALPEGYSEFAKGIEDVTEFGSDLISTAKKELESSGKVLRDIALNNKELSEKFLPKSIMEGLERSKRLEAVDEGDFRQDADSATMTAALGEIFEAQGSQNNASNDIAEASSSVDIGMLSNSVAQSDKMDASNIALSRLVSFNDGIAANYYKKSLELEFKSYFLTRDIYAGQVGYFKDTKTLFEGILKNTALPDIIKSTASEEYMQMSQEKLLGNINESLTNRLSGYFGQFKDNITNKVKGLASSVGDGIEMAGEILNNDMMDDMPQDQKDELIASMAFGMVTDGVSAKVGNKLAETLKKYPNVASSGLELLYLKNNAPFLFEELINSGDESELGKRIIDLKETVSSKVGTVKKGLSDTKDFVTGNISKGTSKISDAVIGVMPDSVKEKIDSFNESRKAKAEEDGVLEDDRFSTVDDIDTDKPSAENSWYVNLLRELAPSLSSDDLVVNNTLMDDGFKSVALDVSMRDSVVNKIPTLLTESVRLLNIIATGTDTNARAYDPVTGMLEETSTIKSRNETLISNKLDVENKNRRMQSMLTLLDPDETLEPKERKEVERKLLSMAAGFEKSGGMFTYDNLINGLDGDTAGKVTSLKDNIESGDTVEAAKYKNYFSREFSGLRNGFSEAQRTVNDLSVAGGRQELDNLGLFTLDPKDPTRRVLDREAYLDLMQGVNKDVPEGINYDDILGRQPDINPSVDSQSPEHVAVDVNIPDSITLNSMAMLDISNIDALPVIVLNQQEQQAREDILRSSVYEKVTDVNTTMTIEELREETKIESGLIFDAIVDQGINTKQALDEFTFVVKEGLSVESGQSGMSFTGIRDELFDELSNNIQAIATYDVNSGEDTLMDDRIVEAINIMNSSQMEANQGIHGLLAGILENIQQSGIAGTDSQTRAGLMGSLGDFAKKTGSGMGTFLNKYYTGLGNFFRGGGAGARDVMGGIGDFFRGRGNKSDVDDSEEDGVGKSGNMLSGLLDTALSPFKAAVDVQKTALNMASGAAKKTRDMTKKLNTKAENVYVGSEKTPRLLDVVMKNGGYFSEATGEPIYAAKDIDGTVLDSKGNPVLTLADMANGIHAGDGKPLSKGRLLETAIKVKDFGASAIKTSLDLTKRGAFTSYNAADKSIDTLSSWFSKGQQQERSSDFDPNSGLSSDIPTIDLIYQHMRYKWPLTKSDVERKGEEDDGETVEDLLREQVELQRQQMESKKKNPLDKDGDGLRDGSWQSRKATKENAKDDTIKTKKEENQEEEKFSLFSLLGTIAGGIGSLGTMLAGALGLGAGGKLLGGAADMAGDLSGYGPDADARRDKRKKGGKLGKAKGIAGKALGMAATAGKAGLSFAGKAASFAGRAALSVGGHALRAVGMAAAGIGTVAAAKLIAVAAIGYGLYKGAKYLASKMDAEPLESIRFMQYGFTEEQGGVLSPLRYLEEYVLDNVEMNGSKVIYNKPPQAEQLEVLMDEFDLEEATAKQQEAMLIWFNTRFVPVLLHHTGVLAGIDTWIDVDDVDDEIDDDDIPMYLNAINTDKMLDSNIYDFTDEPFPDLQIKSNKSMVGSAIDTLLRKYDSDYAKEAAVKDAKKKEAKDKVDSDVKKASLKPSPAEKALGMSGKEKPVNPDVSDAKPKSKVPSNKRSVTKEADMVRYNTPGNYMFTPDISSNTDGSEIKTLKTGGTATTLANGDIMVDSTDSNSVIAVMEGKVTQIGYSAEHGRFIETKNEDGETAVYKNLRELPNVKKGQFFKEGSEITKGKGYSLNIPGRKVMSRKGKLLEASVSTRMAKDALIAKTPLSTSDTDAALNAMTMPETNDSIMVQSKQSGDIELARKAKEMLPAKKRIGTPFTKTESSEESLILTEMTSVNSQYHAKSINQRDEMILLLTQIRDKEMAQVTERVVETAPQVTKSPAPASKPKRKSSVPVTFGNRKSYI